MQTAKNSPPLPPDPSQVTITTTGPSGQTHTISTGPVVEPVAIDPAVAPIAVVEQPHWWPSEKMISLGMVGTFFVMLPISIAIAIRMIRRPVRSHNDLGPGVDQRLTRLEQSIDAIAIEMERVSEGQRYVTRLLASERVAS
jgi:hypothetical protein